MKDVNNRDTKSKRAREYTLLTQSMLVRIGGNRVRDLYNEIKYVQKMELDTEALKN